jgi:hypothetical protein
VLSSVFWMSNFQCCLIAAVLSKHWQHVPRNHAQEGCHYDCVIMMAASFSANSRPVADCLYAIT